MNRVAHDRFAYGARSGGLLVIQRNTRRYLLLPNGSLDRANAVDGTSAAAVAAFLAGETLATAYTQETGGTPITWPQFTDERGKWALAWTDPGSYDEYVPDDPVNPIRRREALSGGEFLTLANQTATVEELVETVVSPTTVSATTSFPLWVAPFAARILSCALNFQSGSIAADNTNYWDVQLRKWIEGVGGAVLGTDYFILADKNTKVTGGEAITMRKAWTFDAETFDATASALAKDDVLDVAFGKFGTAANLTAPYSITIRYSPL